MTSLRFRTFCRALGALAVLVGTCNLGEAATRVKSRPYVIINRNTANAGSAVWRVSQLCKAYNFPTGLPGGGVIGILELGGGWSQDDLDLFSARNNLPPIQVTDVNVDGTTNDYGVDFQADTEVALDIEAAAASYYYATGTMPTIKVFFAQNSDASFKSVIEAAVAAKCDVLSISWGASEAVWKQQAPGSAQIVENAAIAAAASGMAIFAAAGDDSSGDDSVGNNVDVPAACPHIIACGGTNKTKTTETVWGDGFQNDSGTGGGFSSIFPVQSFQLNAPKAPAGLGRMVPDISACADPNTGMLIVSWGFESQVGGTSGVSPLYSGLFAAFGKKLGFVSPTLWKNPKAFVDITKGSNGGYSAAIGADACTGLGVPNGVPLTQLFTNYTPPPPPMVTASFANGILTITGDAQPNNITMTYKQTKVSGVFTGATVTIVPGDTSTIVNGSSTGVALEVGKLRYAVNANMGAGDDTITFNSFFSSTITLALGDGNDTASFLYNSIYTLLSIDGGAGSDVVTLLGNAIIKQTEVNVP
ncbi:MAG: subtilase family protein [Schlesneria sp.]|nr:subtilase family protein [Schlesneria sp.]